MNLLYAREIGFGRYLRRVILYKFFTLLLRRDVEKTLCTGICMRLPRGHDHSAEIHGTNARVDWGAELLLAEYLDTCGERNGQDFVDVGANIGLYSLLMSPRVRRVHAFEPDTRNLLPLRVNAARVPNVEVSGKAVAASSGTRFLDVSGGHELNHLSSAIAPKQGLLSVETTTLDLLRASLPPEVRIAAVKADVEGFECDVLDGAHELTRRDQPVFLVEFATGGAAVNTPERLNAFLNAHDYVVYAVVRDETFVHTHVAELRQLEVAEIPEVRTKMLFLVERSNRFFANYLGPQTIFQAA